MKSFLSPLVLLLAINFVFSTDQLSAQDDSAKTETQETAEVPAALAQFPLTLTDAGKTLTYRGHGGAEEARAEVAKLIEALVKQGIGFTALAHRGWKP